MFVSSSVWANSRSIHLIQWQFPGGGRMDRLLKVQCVAHVQARNGFLQANVTDPQAAYVHNPSRYWGRNYLGLRPRPKRRS